MATKKSDKQSPRMSDEAVQAKTGKKWKEWFAILDKAGARKMTHKEIVSVLSDEHVVGPWWRQMVTATYEQQRGMRNKHEKPDGYQISVSRTLAAPVPKVYQAFATEKGRSLWLDGDGLVVRKATANKSLRGTWKDKQSTLEILFTPKGDGKVQVVVQHSKLPDEKSSARMKIYWSKALDRLRDEVI
jgi:uncharacterized protein YndB with AHSA1/START domain